MESKYKKSILSGFYIQFILLFGVVCLLILIFNIFLPEFISKYIWHIQLFYFAVGMANHLISGKGLQNSSDMHIYYMASMGVRFFLSLIFLFIFIYKMKDGYVSFISNFFILYLVYTSFEIYFLLRNLRPDFKTNGTVDKKV